MDRGHPFAHLPAYVAYALARGRPTRLVLRNTERFGLVHLYFRHGRLARVEGHASTPLNSIADLATWHYGVIRQDDVPSNTAEGMADPTLESALAGVLKDLESRGVVRPAPPAPPASLAHTPPTRTPLRQRVTPPPSNAPSPMDALPAIGLAPLSDVPPYGERSAPGVPPVPGATGLPSLAGVAPPEGVLSSVLAAEGPVSDRITDPQWQLAALFVHQVLEQAVAVIGGKMAEGLLRQSLVHTAKSHVVARVLDLDESGWLKTIGSQPMTTFTAFDVADAIAALLTSFELRCASLMGADEAQRVIARAAAPFRASLAQIGLDVSA